MPERIGATVFGKTNVTPEQKCSSLPRHITFSPAAGDHESPTTMSSSRNIDSHPSASVLGSCNAPGTPNCQVATTRLGSDNRAICNTWPRQASKGRRYEDMASADLFCSCRPVARQHWWSSKTRQPQPESKSTRFGRPVALKFVDTPERHETSPEENCGPKADVDDDRDRELTIRERASAGGLLFNDQPGKDATTPAETLAGKRSIASPELARNLPKKPFVDSDSTEALGGGRGPAFSTKSSESSSSVDGDSADSIFSLESSHWAHSAQVPSEISDLDHPEISVTAEPVDDSCMRPRSTSYHGRLGHKLGKLFSPSGRSRSQTLEEGELNRISYLPVKGLDTLDVSGSEHSMSACSATRLRQAVSADNLLKIIPVEEDRWRDSQIDYPLGRKMLYHRGLSRRASAEPASTQEVRGHHFSLKTSDATSGSPPSALKSKVLSASSSDLHATMRKGKKTPFRGLFSGHDVLRRTVTFHRREMKPKKGLEEEKNEISNKTAKKSFQREYGTNATERLAMTKVGGYADGRRTRKDGDELKRTHCLLLQTVNMTWEEKDTQTRHQRQHLLHDTNTDRGRSHQKSFHADGLQEDAPDAPQFDNQPNNTTTAYSQQKVRLPICGRCLARRRAVFSIAWFREWHDPSSPRPMMMGPTQPVTEETFSPLCTLLISFPGSFSNNFHLVRHRRTGERFAMKRVPLSVNDAENARHARVMHSCLNALRAPFVAMLFYSWLARPPFETSEAHISVSELCQGGTLQHYVSLRLTRLPEYDVRFYAMQVILALHYLHSLDIVVVDLSPRHLLLTQTGYLRLCDVDSAVYLGDVDDASWSVVNVRTTADEGYLAPELLAKGDKTVLHPVADYWGLGLLIYALANFGKTPFSVSGDDRSGKGSDPSSVAQPAHTDAIVDPLCPILHPMWFSTSISEILDLLLQRSPGRRRLNLPHGMSDLFGHRWFTGKLPRWTDVDSDLVFVDGDTPADSVISMWRQVLLQRVRAPYIPELTPGLGIASQNFDKVIAPID